MGIQFIESMIAIGDPAVLPIAIDSLAMNATQNDLPNPRPQVVEVFAAPFRI